MQCYVLMNEMICEGLDVQNAWLLLCCDLNKCRLGLLWLVLTAESFFMYERSFEG